MSTKLICCTVLLFVITTNTPGFAPDRYQWEDLKVLVGSEVAIKTRDKKMVFGTLLEYLPDQLKINRAQNSGSVGINRNNVRKVWKARLNKPNTAWKKGAVIGAGIGAVAVGVPTIATRKERDPLDGLIFPVGAIAGAAVGGAIGGILFRKRHKKLELVYKN